MKTHGMCSSPTYQSWAAMKKRCLYPRHPAYHRYGGRGITICERWMRFENFLKDMGERPSGMNLDREHNDGNYEPGNCRWANPKKQARNRCDTIFATLRGERQSLKEWCEQMSLHYSTMISRVQHGMTPEAALLAGPAAPLVSDDEVAAIRADRVPARTWAAALGVSARYIRKIRQGTRRKAPDIPVGIAAALIWPIFLYLWYGVPT